MRTKVRNKQKSLSYETPSRNSNKCRQIRARLHKAIANHLGLEAIWVQRHVAMCPRCQHRLASLGRVNLALELLKSQPHSLDLLSRANTQAVGVLKRSLREAPKADKLKAKRPEPALSEKCSKYTHSTANVAACLAILLLAKVGVFSCMDKFQTQGQKALKQYYASQVGKDLADEIFVA